MTWMDSYAKIHALTLRWVACDDDLTDWTDEALWPLVSHADMETMMWAMSAFILSQYLLELFKVDLSLLKHIREDLPQLLYILRRQIRRFTIKFCHPWWPPL